MKRCLTLPAMLLLIAASGGVDSSASTETTSSLLSFSRDDLVVSIGMQQTKTDFLPEASELAEEAGRPPTFVPFGNIEIAWIDETAAAIRLTRESEWTFCGIGMGSTEDKIMDTFPFDPDLAFGVHTLTFRIEDDQIKPLTWQAFENSSDPNCYFLSINTSQSGIVYDLVLRDRRFMEYYL